MSCWIKIPPIADLNLFIVDELGEGFEGISSSESLENSEYSDSIIWDDPDSVQAV